MLVATSMAAPSPGAFLAAAPVVTATSSQVIARNHNAAFVAPAVAVAAPVVRAAPLVAAPVATAFAAPIAAPAFAPYTNLAYSGYPYVF